MSIASSSSVKNERLKLETRNAGNIDKETLALKRFDSFASYRSLNGFNGGRQREGDTEDPTGLPSFEAPLPAQEKTNVNEMPPRAPKSSAEKEKRREERKKHRKRSEAASKGKENSQMEKTFSSETEIASSKSNNHSGGGQTSKNEEEEFIESLQRLHRRRRQATEETPHLHVSQSENALKSEKKNSFVQTKNNAFEYAKTESRDVSRAGSGDDENNNDEEVKVDIDRNQRKLDPATVLVSEKFFQPVLDGNTLEFALTPAPQGNIVNCIVTTRKGILSNEYFFYLENFNGEAFLIMRARRKASTRSYFLIDIFNYGDTNEKNKPSETNAARIISNISRNKFKLDLFNTNLASPELLVVSYKTNIGEPRKILADAKLCSGRETFLARDKVTYILKNRQPYFDFKRKKFVLNYNGRAHKSSKNNFQIVDESTPDDVLMQLGKVDTSYYNCDYGFPMCALQAFGFALSSLCR